MHVRFCCFRLRVRVSSRVSFFLSPLLPGPVDADGDAPYDKTLQPTLIHYVPLDRVPLSVSPARLSHGVDGVLCGRPGVEELGRGRGNAR